MRQPSLVGSVLASQARMGVLGAVRAGGRRE